MKDALALAGTLSDDAWSPVELAQSVEDGPVDAPLRVCRELHVLVDVELLDRIEQSENTIAHQIVHIYRVGQVSRHSHGDLLDQRRVADDELLTKSRVLRLLVKTPHLTR